MKFCTNCNKMSPDGSYFCPDCHGELVDISINPTNNGSAEAADTQNSNGNICPQCGTQNEPEAVFCGECGFAFPKSSAAQNKKVQSHSPRTYSPNNKLDMGGTDLSRINSMSFDNGRGVFDEVNSYNRTSIDSMGTGEPLETTGGQGTPTGYASAADVYSSDRQTAADNRTYSNARDVGNSKSYLGRNCFVDGDEKIITTLGSGYVQNIVSSGSANSVSAILTDKRLYCSGKFITVNGKKSQYIKTSKIIEVEDITGTGFTYRSSIVPLIIAMISLTAGLVLGIFIEWFDYFFLCLLIGIVASICPFLIYFLKRETFFNIEYAGGAISFNIKWLNNEACANFQRQIHLIKNKCIKERAESNG